METRGALVGVGVGVGVSPFAEGGLDEALGLALGFWSVGSSAALFKAEAEDGGAPGVGAVAGAVVGVEALGVNAVFGKEGQGGVEEDDGAGGGFIWEELGEGASGMVGDGAVAELPTGAWRVIVLAVTGAAMTRGHDTGELLDIEMNELARLLAFVAADGRRRLQSSEAGTRAAREA